MLAKPTGLLKDIQCECGIIVTQYHVRVGEESTSTFWVTKEHAAPCGKPCSTSPGSLKGDCHITGQCELCPTQSHTRKPPRPRVKSEVSASPILGQLTVNEVRVVQCLITEARCGWAKLGELGAELRIPDATLRGTLRRLAVRGIVRQNAAKQWSINAHLSKQEMETL